MNIEYCLPSLHHLKFCEEIATFNENSQLKDLVYPKVFSLSLNLLETSENQPIKTEEFTKIDQKKLIHKLDEWSEILLNELETNRYQPLQLEKLKEQVLTIFSKQSIELIKKKLRELNIENKKLFRGFSRLNNRIIHILLAPKIETCLKSSHEKPLPNFTDFSSYLSDSYFPHFSFQSLNLQTFGKKYVTRVSLEKINRKISKQKKTLIGKSISSRFCHLTPNIEKNWKTYLLNEFQLLKELDEFSALADIILPFQMVELLHASLEDHSLHKSLIFLFVSLPYETLALVLEGLDHTTILKIHKIFFILSDTSSTAFCQLFKIQRKAFVDTSNNKSEAIDLLDSKFRDFLEPEKIRQADIDDIFNLLNDIQANWKILKKYRQIFTGVVKDAESKRLLFGKEGRPSELDEEYLCHLKRLSDDDDEIEKVRGCPFGIIHRKVFEDRGCSDDQDAYEIFASWGICFLDDWRNVGLLGDITDEEYKRFIEDLQMGGGKGFTYGKLQLEKLGFSTIKDWKKCHIYNKTMLLDYLKKINA